MSTNAVAVIPCNDLAVSLAFYALLGFVRSPGETYPDWNGAFTTEIHVDFQYQAGQEFTFTVRYRGIPADGLLHSNNIHGERTIFANNWPNQIRNWLPMIDHPYDKATGEMIVTAPAHYQVVSNGVLIEESDRRKPFRVGSRPEAARQRHEEGPARAGGAN